MNPQAQAKQPTTAELRAQVVAMMNQMGIPIPPAPDFAMFEGQDPDTVHELMHMAQAEGMAKSIELMAVSLTAARDALDEADGDHSEIVEKIDHTLSAVSVNSLTTSKTALDLQDIEKRLRESDAPSYGHYL